MSVVDGWQQRIIVVTECGFLYKENGSHQRIYDLLDYVSRQFDDVCLYSFYEHVEYPWSPEEIDRFKSAFPRVELVLDHRTAAVRLAQRVRNLLLTVFPGQARRWVRWRVPGAPGWRSLHGAEKNDAYIFNFVDLATIVNGLPDATCLIETHDIKSFKASKALGIHPSSLRIIGKFRSETAVLSAADALIAISPHEASTFRSIAPGPEVFYVPSYRHAPDAPETGAEPYQHDLLFVGADNNFNVDGLVGFIEAHARWLQGRSLVVAGNVCRNPAVQSVAARHPWVGILGFVQDLAPVYARSKAVISPVEGTGLKIKVVEALAHGKPVFASQHSRDALPPGGEGAVFPLATAEMDRIIDDPARLENAREAAARYYRAFSSSGDLDALRVFLDGDRKAVVAASDGMTDAV